MGDFKLPPSFGNEISTVGANPLGALFDDEVTEVTTGGGQPAETTGQTISRQFAAGAPKGGDSEWVESANISTQHSRDIAAQGTAAHNKRFDEKIKGRNARAAALRKKAKENAAQAFKQRLAKAAESRARMMTRVAEGAKTNEMAKAMRADNARADNARVAAQGNENLRAGGTGPATGDVAATAGSGAPAVSFAEPVAAGAPAAGAVGETARQ